MSPGFDDPGAGVLPPDEPFRRALLWIAHRRDERPDVPLRLLVEEASRRFDLSPKQELSLLRYLIPDSIDGPAL